VKWGLSIKTYFQYFLELLKDGETLCSRILNGGREEFGCGGKVQM
jgi:hypothetical protein